MSLPVLMGQLLVGLINGSFYAILSLGLSIIFGLLGIVNLTQGAFYMVGAFFAWMLLQYAGIGYWAALIVAPLGVAVLGMAIEVLLIRRIYGLDHSYGLLLTFGLLLIIQGSFVYIFGTAGQPYPIPDQLRGGYNLGFMFLPKYRLWVIAVALGLCFATWYSIEHTWLGRALRAATENAPLTRAFGINVPRLVTLAFGLGVGLSGLAGVLAAPIYAVSPLMGADLIIVVFAVVVIGGMGSILGSILTGVSLGLIEGLTKVIYPQASSTAIFVMMIVILLFKPTGLFGWQN
jgi:branched-chain amino acid transport system permease protein